MHSNWQPKQPAQEQGGDDIIRHEIPKNYEDLLAHYVAVKQSLRETMTANADACRERDDLRARFDDEKKRRVYYQGIVYDVMNSMSNGKMVCGTIDEPSTQVQDGVRLVLKHRNEFEQEAMDLRVRLADEKKSCLEFAKGVEDMAKALDYIKGICDRGGYEGTDKEKMYAPLRILGYVKKLERQNAELNLYVRDTAKQ